MTTENRRASFKPHAFLAALGLALAFLPSSSKAGNIPLLSSATFTAGTDDQARAVARDGAGSLFVVGFSSAGGQGKDIWVSRWNESSLALLSSATFNGTGNGYDVAQGVARDDAGNVFVAGISSVAGAGSILWLGKFDPTMVFVSSITYPIPMAANTLEPTGIVIAPGGNLFVVKTSSAGNTTMALAQFTPTLTFVSSTTFFNGFDQNYGFGLTRDSGGNLYMSGSAPPSPGTTGDIWVGKFNSSLVLVASTTVAGPGGNFDQARGIVMGSDGNVYVSGTINNTGGIVDLWVGKYSPALALLNSASYPSPISGNAAGNAIAASSNRIYTVGQVAVSGQGANAWITELDYNLTLLSSGTHTSAGATTDEYWGLAIDTMTGIAFAVGMVTPSVPQGWIAKYGLPGYAPFPGCAVTNNVGAGQAFATIQAAVNALPTTLTGHSCVVIRDGATYGEQVTVQNFITAGSSITIMADPGSGLRPVVSPPAFSTAAFRIANASVSVTGLDVVVNLSVPYGVWASSAYVKLTGVAVSTSGSLGFTGAGVRISSWSAITNSSVTAWNAHGIWLDGGSYSSISYSTAVSKSSTTYGLYLLGADSNTVTGSVFSNPEGTAVRLDAGSDYNSLGYSSLSSNRYSFYALYFNSSDSNTVTGLNIQNPGGNGIAFWAGSDLNAIHQSTVVSNGADGQAVALVASDKNIFTNSYLQHLAGWGAYIHTGSDSNAISFTTMTVDSALRYALYIYGSSSNTITQSNINNPAGDAARLEYSHYNTIAQSAMTSGSANKSALYLTVSSFNVVTQSFVSNPSGYGAQLLDAGRNTIDQTNMQSSTSTAPALKITATGPNKAVFNLVSRSDIYNPAGHAGMISFNANNNDVYRSTFTSSSSIHRALEINSVSSTTVTQSYMANSTGYGLFVSFSTGVSINDSKMESSSGFGLYVDVSSGVIWNGSKAQGNPAVYVRGSTQTVISSGELNTFGGGKGLWIANGNVGVSASFLTVYGASAAEGILLDGPNAGVLSFSSVTIGGPNAGFSIAPQAPGAVLSVASVTFQGLSAGATAVNFIGGTFVSTFSGVYFADSSIAVNVNGAPLGGGSRITMVVAGGMRGGPAFENDPAGFVDWPNFGVGGITAAPFSAVTNVALTANWNSSFPGGTNYTAELSTGGFPNGFPGNQSVVTANLYQIFSGLNSGTPYFARVSTNPATGPFTLLGSTVTSGGSGAGTITALPYTNVSANSLTANWNTTFGGGTVYSLRISTNAFATVNAVSTTTNVSFFFGGLLPATSYEVRVSTLFSGVPFTGLGVATTPAAGGGSSVNFNFNNAAQGAVIASANGQNEMGLGIVADPAPGGDIYVIFASTPGATGSRNKSGHDTAGVVGIARYGSAGAVISSRTLANDTRGDLVRDNAGYVYVAETDRSQGAPMRITKYSPDLNPVNSVAVPMAGEFGAMISTGTSIFALVENTSDNTARIMNYDPNLVAVATAAFYSLGGLPVRGHGMAREKNAGFLYVLVSTTGPNSQVRMLRYPSNAGALNGATPLDIAIPDVTAQQNPRIAISGDKLYVAFTDLAGQNIIVRQYTGSLSYTGFSSTMTNVTAPFGKAAAAIQADDLSVFVGGTVNTGGGGDYLVMKLDPNNGLAFVSSAAFNSTTYLADQLSGLAIGASGEILVTGASSNTISDANAMTTGLYLGVGGGQAGAVSSAPYTSVSTSSFIANWYTSFPGGTVYFLEISTDVFATVSAFNTAGGNNFPYSGLAPNTSYSVRLSTTGSGPYTQLGAVSTLGGGVAITGTLNYAGVEPGMIRVEAFTTPAFTGVPVSSQILSLVPSQPYYLPVGAGTFYVRAYVDVFGGGNYQGWLDQGTTGPFTLSASSLTGRNFSITPDSIAPNSPLGLYATPSGGQVYLGWSPPTTSTNGAALLDLRGYIIRRSTGVVSQDIAGSPSLPISSGTLSFTDFSPVPNVSNYYTVIAVDYARNQSMPSSPASVSAGTGGSGGTIYGHISTFTLTTSGTYRVRLSSRPGGPYIAESNQEFYSFPGLSSGTYYLSGFRDLNENGVQESFEPAGLFGGLNNNPFPIYVSGTNSVFADVSLCDRALLQVGSPVSGSLYPNSCPARDAGFNRTTELRAFEAGTGSAGSVSTGTALTLFMSQLGGVYDSRLIVLGPSGLILADNSSPGGAAVSVTPTQVGVYVVEPTSFYENTFGGYNLTMSAGASGQSTDGINGTLSYAGSQSGNIAVRFFNNPSFAGVPVATMTVAAGPGAFSGLTFDKRYLPLGTYYVDAFRDTAGSGAFNPSYQAYGRCSGGLAITINAGSPLAAVGSCALSDPSAGGGGGNGVISGSITYNGSLSGIVRTSLFTYGSAYPVANQSAAFASTMPYSFTGLGPGTYFVKAFADPNGNFVPDASEQVALSPAKGIGIPLDAVVTGQNFALCDRSPIADGVPVTAYWSASDCPSADRAGAYMKMYTFTGRRGQSVTIGAKALGFYGTFVALYDPEGNLAAFDDGAVNGNATITGYALPIDGLYTIGASPYAPGVTGQIELSFRGSSGALGSISGSVDYQGTQGGRMMVVLFDSPSFSSSTFVDSRILFSTRNFLFDNLFAGSSYYLGAFVDVNYNDTPDQSEDKGQFGGNFASPIFLNAGQNMTGASILIGASTASAAGASYVTGAVYYAGAQTGQVTLEFWPGGDFTGRPVAVRNIPTGIVLSSASYDVSLPGGSNYFIRAFLDVNGDFMPNPSEPKGVYAPYGQGAESVYVPASQTVSGINVTMIDPGQTAGGGVAGEGTAVVTSTSIAGGQQFSLGVVYTAGANGIAAGGKVGMTVPPNFPFPFGSVWGSSVTARSGSALSPVIYSGPSVFVTLSAPLAAGATVGFEWSNVYAPCAVGTATFTVTSVSNGAGAPTPLFAGSPSVRVVSGQPAFFQLDPPYFSVKAGELSDITYLESRDNCGNKVPLTAAKTVDMRGSVYSPVAGKFTVDPDIGLSTGAAVSTAPAVTVDFAVGQSSRPFYVVAASTGFKNLEVHYDLQYDTTFYFGINALPGNALSGVYVSTTSGATALSSASISLGANGLTNQIFIGFTLGDVQQSWRVLFSSIPFKPGVPPTPVWERWGYGQPRPGEIAWDGRFNPWINGGARVPNGLYYGRVEVGGSGVKNDSLRVAVSLPSFAGRIYDPAIAPNPPLSDVQLRVYGPSGYFTAVTGADGAYAMPGLGAGAYRLNLSRADYVDGVVDMTLDSTGKAASFVSRTAGLAVSSNAAGGLDAYLGRAPRLIVVPSLDASIAAETFDQWGSLQVRSSTGANSNTIYGPMRLKAGTTTFDDGGQWDPSTQQFVEKTLLAFNVPVGTYTVVAELNGLSRSTGTVYVSATGARIDLPAFKRKTVVTGQVFVAANPYGMGVSVVAVPLSTAVAEGGFAHVFLNPGTTSALYTMGGLEGGSYILRANAQSLSAVSLGPVTVPASGTLAQQDFPVFGAGAAISGTIFTVPPVAAGSPIYMNAWSPGSFNFGSTVVYANAGGSAGYAMPGLDASATYQLFVNVSQNGGDKAEYDGGFPKLVMTGSGQNFTLTAASGVVMGTIYLQTGATDFLNVVLYGKTLAALRPERVGEQFVEVSTTTPGFSCGGLPASNPSSSPVAGYCPGVSSATFLVTGANTETIELSFLHKTSGQSSKQILSIVNGATSYLTVDLSSQTFAISGSIINQITASLFNTNPKVVDNAPYIAPLGFPAGLSSTTARVTAIRQDIDAYGVAVSTVFNPLTSRVGYIVASGTFTIPNVPKGVYLVRTADLRACATCPILVPAVGKVISVAGASVSSVTLTLSDGYSVSGSISLDGGILDSRIFDVSVLNRRQEVVRSTVVYLGDVNQGVTANSVDYAFTNLPAGEFYTLTVRGRLFPIKYAGRPIKFPDAALSPNGLQSSLTAQNVTMKRAAYIVGRLKDAATGESIRAANATLLAPNFSIKATANPWTEGGYVAAASSTSARPIEGDGYFRVGPLIPDIAYDLRLAQATWDPNFLASGSQNYAPVTISGLKPTPGEIRDVGVVSLGQGQSITGVVRSSTTLLALGNIKVTARPSFGGDDQLVVQSFTNSQGAYSLWVSSAVSNQFTLVVAPRDGNQASDGMYYGAIELTNVNLQTQATANFLLTPLPVVVTGQVLVPDAASGGALSYPFGDKRGFPAAAINLQPVAVVSENPLGDIETATDERGYFTVPGLSTGVYRLHATSLGYAVYNATVQVIGTSFSIFTGTNTQTGGLLTLARGATATGRILKSDGSAPNSDEVVGVAAANFAAGEFVVGSVETDAVAKTVSAYTISGFKTGISYDVVLLSGSGGNEVSFPTEGAGVSFSAAESTTTKSINLTYRPARLDCLGTAKALDAARSRFLVQIDCLKPLRQENAADDDLTTILTLSTYTAAGAALAAPNGAGVLSNPSNSTSRRLLTATYTLATNETRFSIRIRAYAAEVDPTTGDNFAIDKVFDFYAGLDASADGRATNINGGSVGMKPSAQDELLGLDERSRIDLPPGAFAEGSDSLSDSSVVANPTTTVNVSMSKGRDQTLAKALTVAKLGYAPAALELPDNPSSYPAEMWAAMSTYRTAASTTQVGGANPISAFYSIFLPAGIRHQLKQRADLTLSYNLAASTSTTDDKIQIYFYNAVLGRFVPETVNRRLDTVNKTITVSVDHFSTFVVLDSTPVATSTVSFGGADIAVANFPNPADCITHSNIARNSTLFGSGGVHAPFTGTMIRTSIPLSGAPADLKINIYTVAGEKIRTIEQGQVPAGQTYYTPWNCTNDSGGTVASGVYIGEAIHGGRRKFFKIAIIKGSGL